MPNKLTDSVSYCPTSNTNLCQYSNGFTNHDRHHQLATTLCLVSWDKSWLSLGYSLPIHGPYTSDSIEIRLRISSTPQHFISDTNRWHSVNKKMIYGNRGRQCVVVDYHIDATLHKYVVCCILHLIRCVISGTCLSQQKHPQDGGRGKRGDDLHSRKWK